MILYGHSAADLVQVSCVGLVLHARIFTRKAALRMGELLSFKNHRMLLRLRNNKRPALDGPSPPASEPSDTNMDNFDEIAARMA